MARVCAMVAPAYPRKKNERNRCPCRPTSPYALDTTNSRPRFSRKWCDGREMCPVRAPAPLCPPTDFFSSKNDAGCHEIRARSWTGHWSILRLVHLNRTSNRTLFSSRLVANQESNRPESYRVVPLYFQVCVRLEHDSSFQ